MNQTEQAHKNLQNILLNGRIVLNGLPLNANEISTMIQHEHILYSRASELDRANEAKTTEKKE